MTTQTMTLVNTYRMRRHTFVMLALLLVSTSIVGSVEVSPDGMNWRSSVEAAPAGTTVSFLPGVYRGCSVTVPTGVTLAAKTSSSKVIIDCENSARCLYLCVFTYKYDSENACDSENTSAPLPPNTHVHNYG